jgi:hypothetical protein
MDGRALLARGGTKKKSIVTMSATRPRLVNQSPTLPLQEEGGDLEKIEVKLKGKRFPMSNILRCGHSDTLGRSYVILRFNRMLTSFVKRQYTVAEDTLGRIGSFLILWAHSDFWNRS